VVAKVEFHFWGIVPPRRLIVTNLATESRAVVRLYNKRGAAEQSRRGLMTNYPTRFGIQISQQNTTWPEILAL
jgi:hypothetical protein